MVSFVVNLPDLRDVVPGTIFHTEDSKANIYMVIQEMGTPKYHSQVPVLRLSSRPTVMYLDECTNIVVLGMLGLEP